MDNTTSITLNHYLTNWLKVKTIDVIIFNDAGNNVYSLLSNPSDGLPYVYGGTAAVTSATIVLNRAIGGGLFDAAAFSNLPNRGYFILGLME
jgi:hypothetical protein